MSDTTERPSASITGSGLTSDLGTSRVATIIHGEPTGFRYLDARKIPERDFNVVTRGGQSNNSQRWVLTDTGGALYTIMQVSSNRYLDAHEIESLDFRVVTRPRRDNDTQLWRILRDADRAAVRQVSSGRALQPYLTEDKDFLLGVSVSWFYKTRNCQPTKTEKRRALVDAAVAKEFRAARGLHGSPRLFLDLRAKG
jgi:hypothetical protein